MAVSLYSHIRAPEQHCEMGTSARCKRKKNSERERERKTVALILLAWVKKRDTVKWKNSSFLSAPQLTS